MTPTPAKQAKVEKVVNNSTAVLKTTEEEHLSTEKENRNEGDGSKTTKNQNLRAEVRPFKLATDFEPSDSHLNTFPEELRQRVLKWMPSSAQLMTIKLVCRSLNVSAKALEDAFFEEVTSLRFDLPYRAICDGCVDAGSDDHHQQQEQYLEAADGEFFHPNDGPTVSSCFGVSGGNTAFGVHRGLLVKLAGDDQQCEELCRPQPLNTFEPRALDRYSQSTVLLCRQDRNKLESESFSSKTDPALFNDNDYHHQQRQHQQLTTKVISASEPAYDVVHQVVNLQLAIQSVDRLGYWQHSAAFIAACRRMANVRQLTLVNAVPLFGGMAAADQPGRQPFTLAHLWPALKELRLVGRLTVPSQSSRIYQVIIQHLYRLRRLRTFSTTLLLNQLLKGIHPFVFCRLEELNVRVKLRRVPPAGSAPWINVPGGNQIYDNMLNFCDMLLRREGIGGGLNFPLLGAELGGGDFAERQNQRESMTDDEVDRLVQQLLPQPAAAIGRGGGGGRLRRLGLRVDDNASDCGGRLLFRSAAVRSCLHRLSFRQPITLEALAWTTATFKALTYLDFAVEQYDDAKAEAAKRAAATVMAKERRRRSILCRLADAVDAQGGGPFVGWPDEQLFRRPPPPEEEDPAAVFSIAGSSVDFSPFSFTFSSLISRLRELPLLRELKFSLLQPANVRSLVDDDADFVWTATVLSRSLTLPTVRRVQASFKVDYHHLHLLKNVFPAAERITFVLPVVALLSPEWRAVMCRSGQSCSVCVRVEALVEAALKEKATTVIIPVYPDSWAQGKVLIAKDDDYEELGYLGFYEGEPLDHHQSTEEENRNEGDGSKTTKNQNLRAEVRPFELATEIEPSDSHLNTFPEELRQKLLKWMPSSAQLMTIKLVCRSLYDSAKALEDAFFEEVTSLRFDLPYRAIRDGCVDAGSDDHHQQQHHFLDVADGEFFHPNDGPTLDSCLGVGGGNTAFRVHRGLLVKLNGDDQQCEELCQPQPLNTFEPRARDRYSKSAVLLRRRDRNRLENRIPDLFKDNDYQRQQQQQMTIKVISASEPAYDVVYQVNLQLAIQSMDRLGYWAPPAAFIATCRRMANVRQLTLVNAAPLFGSMAVQPGRQQLTLAQLWPALEELRLVGRLKVPFLRGVATVFDEAADGFEEWLPTIVTAVTRQNIFRQLHRLPRLRTLSTTLLLSRLDRCPISLPVLRRLEELNVRVKLRRGPPAAAAMELALFDGALQPLRFDLLFPPDRDQNRGPETMTDGDVDHLVQRILEQGEGGGGGGGEGDDGQHQTSRGRLRRLGLRVDDNASDCGGRLLFRSPVVRSCLHRLSFRQPITLEALAWTTATFKALTYLDFAVEQYDDAKVVKAAKRAAATVMGRREADDAQGDGHFVDMLGADFFPDQRPLPPEEEDPAAIFSIAGPSVEVTPASFTFSTLISRLRELPQLRELKFSFLQPASVRLLADDHADFQWTATVLSRSLTLPTVRRVQASFKADYHHLHLLKRVFPAAERITFVLPVAALLSPEWRAVMCRSGQSCSVCDRMEALVEAALKEKATTVIIPVHPDSWAQGKVLIAKDDDYEELGHLGFYEGGPELLF
ncbi:hypothetical protein TYRP_022756 [Tyrophagus putrescentiae]|nr:hypothetical protein TYRP_022756 [Tyrophagus putrescentiae]